MFNLLTFFTLFVLLCTHSYANYILYVSTHLNPSISTGNETLNSLAGARLEWAIEVSPSQNSSWSNSVNMRSYEAVATVFRISGGTPFDGDYSFSDQHPFGDFTTLSAGSWGNIRISFNSELSLVLNGETVYFSVPYFSFSGLSPNLHSFSQAGSLLNHVAGLPYTIMPSYHIAYVTDYETYNDFFIDEDEGFYAGFMINNGMNLDSFQSNHMALVDPRVALLEQSVLNLQAVINDLEGQLDAIGSALELSIENNPSAEAMVQSIESLKADYNAAIIERDARLSLDEVKDLRPGSSMIEIENGSATLSMEIEQSDDLNIWTTGGPSTLQIPIQAGEGKKFFRFKMAE